MGKSATRIWLAASACLGICLLLTASAAASPKHVFQSSFAGSGDNALASASDVDLDQASGDVYVSDPADFRVEKFSAAGQFILMFGKGVDKTTGADVCSAASGDECQPGAQGLSPGAFYGAQLFLAVDNSDGPSAGDVYVGDAGDSLVSKFDSDGQLIRSWGAEGQLDGSSANFESFSPGVELTGLRGVAVDPAGKLFVTGAPIAFWEFEFSQSGEFLRQVTLLGKALAVDGGENSYAILGGNVTKNAQNAFVLAGGALGIRLDAPTRELYVTREDGSVAHLPADCEPVGFVKEGTVAPTCPTIESFGSGHLSQPSGVAIDESTGTVYVADGGDDRVVLFGPEPSLASATRLNAQALSSSSEALGAHVDPAGAGPIEGCKFEYGETTSYAFGAVPCSAVSPISTAADVEGDSDLSGLEYATTYHFRVLLENANGTDSSYDETFTTLPLAPAIGSESVSDVQADGALIHAQINPGGARSTYRVEYVTDEQFKAGEFSAAQLSPELQTGNARSPEQLSAQLSALLANTTYRYRVIATNAANPGAPVRGSVETFSTLPAPASGEDPCANAHVRQQTGAAALLDCRAYELVSTAEAGGYDVESNLVAGQSPFGGYPDASGRVLYGVHGGGVPGTDHPTNRGVDPYLAQRGPEGWSTSYVGIPANDPFAGAPFSSPLLGADAGLQSFAFGGPGLCSPCFGAGGVETGIPLRLPGGALVQGMAGAGEEPEARPEGFIATPLSANGEHLIFGSTSPFAEGGNENSGDVSIYDRNLRTATTAVVSNSPSGGPLGCRQGAGHCHAPGDANGIASLGVSGEGQRILLAQKVGEDADHNPNWHLYMNVDDSPTSIDLTPGASDGVLYDGMSADGNAVYFTTSDKLLPEDGDKSPDIYRAVLGETSATLSLVSRGASGPSNSDACDPLANQNGAHWNTLAPEENCGALAIGGGGGVAAKDGSIYFLSPELLAGAQGTKNAPNLYLSRPGSAPSFVATLDPEEPLVLDALREPGTRHSAEFQVSGSGDFAAFPSSLEKLPEEHAAGHTELYVYEAEDEALACASCGPTGAPAQGDSSLASDGLSLTEDGRLFFNSSDQLAAADSDGREDIYEWERPAIGGCSAASPSFARTAGACVALVSAGTSPFDSALLSATEDATDVYFFTRDSLAPSDQNGPTVKVYDAREGGGFPYSLPAVQCQASDECHGVGSPPPPPAQVSSGAGKEINPTPKRPCKKGSERRHGRCVKKKPKHHRSHGGRK